METICSEKNGKQVLTTTSKPNGDIREESSSSSLSNQDSSDTAQSQRTEKKRKELLKLGHKQEDLKKKKKKQKIRALREEAQDGQSLWPLEASNTSSHSNQETTSCSSTTTTTNTTTPTTNGAKNASLKNLKKPPGVRLVWVSTKKGVGVKITHGVMYISKESQNGCKIVCHCHRTHFSLAQFVQHGGGSPPQIANPHMNIVVRMEFL